MKPNFRMNSEISMVHSSCIDEGQYIRGKVACTSQWQLQSQPPAPIDLRYDHLSVLERVLPSLEDSVAV